MHMIIESFISTIVVWINFDFVIYKSLTILFASQTIVIKKEYFLLKIKVCIRTVVLIEYIRYQIENMMVWRILKNFKNQIIGYK